MLLPKSALVALITIVSSTYVHSQDTPAPNSAEQSENLNILFVDSSIPPAVTPVANGIQASTDSGNDIGDDSSSPNVIASPEYEISNPGVESSAEEPCESENDTPTGNGTNPPEVENSSPEDNDPGDETASASPPENQTISPAENSEAESSSVTSEGPGGVTEPSMGEPCESSDFEDDSSTGNGTSPPEIHSNSWGLETSSASQPENESSFPESSSGSEEVIPSPSPTDPSIEETTESYESTLASENDSEDQTSTSPTDEESSSPGDSNNSGVETTPSSPSEIENSSTAENTSPGADNSSDSSYDDLSDIVGILEGDSSGQFDIDGSFSSSSESDENSSYQMESLENGSGGRSSSETQQGNLQDRNQLIISIVRTAIPCVETRERILHDAMGKFFGITNLYEITCGTDLNSSDNIS